MDEGQEKEIESKVVPEEEDDLDLEEEEGEDSADGSYVAIPKKGLILLIIGILVLAAGAVVWHYKLYRPLLNRYNASTIVLKVKEGDKYELSSATLTVNGAHYTTDDHGRVTLAHIVAGVYPLTITKDGYQSSTITLKLHRGDNDAQIFSIEKLPDKLFAVKGFVTDWISGKTIEGVQVTMGSKTVATDPSGEYIFTALPPGNVKLILSKAGYTDKELPIAVVDADVVTSSVPLVPSGQVVFVSNRDGKRALYTSSYDGSGQHLYVTKFTEGEQFDPIRSPNGDWTLFTSTNEKIRNSNGYEMGKLQLVSQDGLTVTKVSEDVAYSFSPLWSPNSQRFYFTGYTNPQMSQATYKVYDLSKKSTVDIGESANGLVFTPDSSTVLYSTLSSEDKPASDTVPASRVEYYSLKSLNVSTGERKTLSKHDQYLSEIRVASSGKSASFETVVDNARRRFEVSLTGDPAEHEVPVVLSTKRRYFFSPQHTQQAFIEERDGKKDVFVVDASEQNEKRLTTLGVVNDAFDPLWSDDGRYLTFAVKREGENGLYIVSLDGGDPKKITDFYAP